MAKTPFSATKHDKSSLNSGYQYTTDDQMSIEALNNTIENSLYASNIAENVANQLSNLNPNEKIEFKGSNPNLLINGDFRVNQRGKAEYRKTGRDYTLDRWKVYVDNTSSDYIITPKQNGGVTIDTTNSAERIVFQQPFEEKFEYFAGKTFTGSAKINDVVYSFTTTIPSTKPNDSLNLGSIDIPKGVLRMFYQTNGEIVSFDLYVGVGTTFQVEYVKLEIGSVATAFSPRPYAEELTLCQRYYQRLSLHGGVSALNGNGWELLCQYALPVTMRQFYSLTNIQYPTVRGQGTYGNAVSNINADGLSDNGIRLILTTSGLTSHELYTVFYGSLDIDAEIH